jgi:hypothetical protein
MTLLRLKTPAVRFDRLGVPIGGEVQEDAREVQQYDFDSQLPLYWSEDGRKVTEKVAPDGAERKPCLQLVVAVQTGSIDPTIPGDDGVRSIFIKSGLLKATRAECQRLRIDAIRKGMTFFATWTGETPPPAGRRGKPSKDYKVDITVPPPAPSGLLAAEPVEEIAAGARERMQEVLARTARAHESSPVLNKRAQEEPPF